MRVEASRTSLLMEKESLTRHRKNVIAFFASGYTHKCLFHVQVESVRTSPSLLLMQVPWGGPVPATNHRLLFFVH